MAAIWLELNKIGSANHRILVNSAEMRLVPKPCAFKFGRPSGFSRPKFENRWRRRTANLRLLGAARGICKGAKRICGSRHVIEHALRRSRSNAR